MTVFGRSLPDLSHATLRTCVASVLDRNRTPLATATTVVVLPDVHYPFHPSTGLVTNPALVGAFVDELTAIRDDVRVVVGCASSEAIDAVRSARYLEYDRLTSSTDVELLALPGCERVDRTVRVGDRTVTVPVPSALRSGTVVAIPTVRRSTTARPAAGAATLSRAVYDRSSTPIERAAAIRACRPALSVLDGTYTYTGEPHASAFVVASSDVDALDRVAATLLGLDPDTIPYLRLLGSVSDREYTADGVSIPDLATTLPNRDPARSILSERALSAGYRLYARLSGDCVPPRFV